ncbi:MAG: TraB/GumN family protein [Chitinophagaceae bacterium]|nr:TraB/GumN family protein [Chitinophagaceae bacterium]
MKLKFPLVVALFVVYSNLNAQTKWPSTLLWKISGNGLKKDSYLYGSMHMLDKRLFYFSDSLYHFIEKADGFAMEISIRELMDTIMTQAIFEKQKDLYKPDIAITEALAEVEIDSAAPMQPPPPPPPGADLEMIPVAKKSRDEIRLWLKIQKN